MSDDLESQLAAAQERINVAKQNLQEAKDRLTIVYAACSQRTDPKALVAHNKVSKAAIAYSDAVMAYSALIHAKHRPENN